MRRSVVFPTVSDAALGAAFFSPCTSAHVALHTIGDLRPAQTVLVTGATGDVGSIACQLALTHGAHVIGTVSRPERLSALTAGVDGSVVSGEGGHPVESPDIDLLIDTVGGAILSAVLQRVVPGGRAVLIGYLAGPTLEIDLSAFMQRDVSLHPLNMIRRDADGRAVTPALVQMLADGRLVLEITEFALDDAAEALDWLDQPGHRGRAVLTPSPAPAAARS